MAIEPVMIEVQATATGIEETKEQVRSLGETAEDIAYKQVVVERQLEMAMIRREMILTRLVNTTMGMTNTIMYSAAVIGDFDKEQRKQLATFGALLNIIHMITTAYQMLLWSRRMNYHAMRMEQLQTEALRLSKAREEAQSKATVTSKGSEATGRFVNMGAIIGENSAATFGAWLPIGLMIVATVLGIIASLKAAGAFHRGGIARDEGIALLKAGEVVLPKEAIPIARREPLSVTGGIGLGHSTVITNNFSINITGWDDTMAERIREEIRNSIIRAGGNPYERY